MQEKSKNVLMAICTALIVLLSIAGSLSAAVVREAEDAEFYSTRSRQAVQEYLRQMESDLDASAYIGMSEAEQQQFAGEMSAWMKGEGELPDGLNSDEKLHMEDVRRIIRTAKALSRGCTVAAMMIALLVIWMSAMSGPKDAAKPIAIGAVLSVLLLAGTVAAGRGMGFDAAFIRMHQLLFTNDLWLMDPATDILIRMMPSNLFEAELLRVMQRGALMAVLTLAALCIFGMMLSGQIRRMEQEGKNK